MRQAPPDSWADRKILVTGATGLVGSHLVLELLRRRAAVTALVRDDDRRSELVRSGAIGRVATVNGELEQIEVVERAILESECSTVFHLGAQTIVGLAVNSPLLTLESNVRGTYNVLEACRRHPGQVDRLVVASSDKAYGPSDRPYEESDPLRPDAPYDASKAAADLIAHSFFSTFRMPVAIVRCGNTYGGGDLNWSRIVPGTIRSVQRGEAPEIRSDGRFVRDYIYVDDVVAAYLATAEGLPGVSGEVFNFASGTETAVVDIVRMISELMGRSDLRPKILNTARSEIREQRLSIEKAQRVLGWRPQVSLADGLQRTIDWYRSYLGEPQ